MKVTQKNAVCVGEIPLKILPRDRGHLVILRWDKCAVFVSSDREGDP
jgi:hypothetical protein